MVAVGCQVGRAARGWGWPGGWPEGLGLARGLARGRGRVAVAESKAVAEGLAVMLRLTCEHRCESPVYIGLHFRRAFGTVDCEITAIVTFALSRSDFVADASEKLTVAMV